MSARSQQNAVKAYCKPAVKNVLKAYAEEKGVSLSEIGETAIQAFVDALPADEKVRLLNKVSHKSGKSKNHY